MLGGVALLVIVGCNNASNMLHNGVVPWVDPIVVRPDQQNCFPNQTAAFRLVDFSVNSASSGHSRELPVMSAATFAPIAPTHLLWRPEPALKLLARFFGKDLRGGQALSSVGADRDKNVRDRQISLNVAGVCHAETDDFAGIIDPEGGQQIQRRVGWTSVLRSLITPLRHRNARGFPLAGPGALMEAPTTSPRLLMPKACANQIPGKHAEVLNPFALGSTGRGGRLCCRARPRHQPSHRGY